MPPVHMVPLAVVTLLCILGALHGETDNLFSAFSQLRDMFDSNSQVTGLLTEFLQSEDLKLDKMKKYVDTFKAFQELANGDLAEFIGNPINAFLLVKQLAVDWNELETLLKDDKRKGHEFSSQGNLSKLLSAVSASDDDEIRDEDNAALAILRLQDVYNLSATDLVAGRMAGWDTGVMLAADDCVRMAQHAMANLDVELALTWYYRGMDQHGSDSDDVAQHIRTQIRQLQLVRSLLQSSGSFVTSDIMKSLASVPGIPTQIFQKLLVLSGKQDDTSSEAFVQKTYKKLCQGEPLLPVKVTSLLECMYVPHDVTGNLQRVKVEYLSYHPMVVLLHGIVSDSEVERLQDLSAARLQPTQIHAPNDIDDVRTSSTRVGKATWLGKNVDDLIGRLYSRVEDVTGLAMDLETTEALHVIKYGVGGHYDVHMDFFDLHSRGLQKAHGDRMATILFYLSDVPQGGATVFPHLLLSVKPQKGSALFWFNLFRSGKGDFRTIHGACPVIQGSKWVANLWVLDRGQMFRRPCSLNEGE